ncbi:MAG TPA: DUF2452 domain-containing protein [Bacteroidetes bacterium]|nr:MAG: DUF2452 domain-containing protein [Rhodothermaeota bacterium MED-G64]RPF79470.1 MAG: DUF2452 domain-containing protein [Rhodothermaceae bacterium TMED105]HBD43091.1 DUF2452 domain-containing protein [Bacteroidota bacterium]HBV99909.1 DUF2452 domain-containing protein [Bacteroidota bacterium]
MKENKKKKPDSIVFDEEKGYNAAVLPYGTSVGAPAIKLDNISGWKEQGTMMVNKELKIRFKELEDQYIKLVEEHRWNELVYAAEFNFEPVIGQIYYLYDRGGVKGKPFLSMITPEEWGGKKGMEFIGSFALNHNRKWILQEAAPQTS